MKVIILMVVALLALPGGGCVFGEIRDEVRTSNARIGEVEAGLDATTAAIDQTNRTLGNVEQGLARLDTTNVSLKDVQEQLAMLQSIEGSLTRVDVHLASLRKTIGQIDSAIPFLDLGSDDSEAPADSAGAPAPEAERGAEAQPAGAEAAPAHPEGVAAPRRDAIIGAWVSQYPDRSAALVVLDGGRYVWQFTQPGGERWTTESGAWRVEGAQLHLVPETSGATSPAPAAPSAAPKAARAEADSPPPSERTFEIISRSARSMTLRAADGRLTVLAKP